VTNFSQKLSLFCILAIACSCATPTSPTGGPADQEGPKIVSTEPETGTVNFEGRAITFYFSEFVNRSSLRGQVNVEPDIGIAYELDWGRKSVSIEFEDALPELTTLIVTIGTGLTDTNGNKLAAPHKVAVSTGPEIDEGQIYGKILDAKTGKGTDGNRVLLYRTPFELNQKADYIAETDTGGVFQFSYLRQGLYKALWVDDRNRNKIWEQDRERAQPFSRETVELEKAGSDTLNTIYIANSDTTEAVLQGVGLFSSQRLRMRFSENVQLTDSTELSISDSLGTRFADVYPLYNLPSEPYVLFAQSEEALAENLSYSIQVRNISDPAGNITDTTSFDFTGSAQSDTTLQRIIERKRSAGIYPSEAVEVIYAKPITESEISDSLKIVEGSSLIEGWEHISIDRNRFLVEPENEWKQGIDYEFRFYDPLTQDLLSVSPAIWHTNQLGELNIQLSDTSRTNTYRLFLRTEERGLVADTTFSKRITLSGLAPIPHQLILFEDLNDNGSWDFGQVQPYRAPEPYFIRNNIPVREGFTSDLEVAPEYYPNLPEN